MTKINLILWAVAIAVIAFLYWLADQRGQTIVKLKTEIKSVQQELNSCNKIKATCETSYSEEVKNFNEQQKKASETIQRLQDKTLSNASFEDCLNMRIPDGYARVFNGKDGSDKNRKTKN